MIDRNEVRLTYLECRYEGCGKVCESKVVLVHYQKMIHRPLEERVRLECSRCGLVYETDLACLMQESSCTGESVDSNRLKFCICGARMSRANYARHGRTCGESEGEATVIGERF